MAALELEFQQADAERQSLEAQCEQVQLKLARSEQLLAGLAGQKGNWTDRIAQISQDQQFITSDCLLAAASCLYLGPFKLEHRGQLVQRWQAALSHHFSTRPSFSLPQVLSSELEVSQWVNVHKLAND